MDNNIKNITKMTDEEIDRNFDDLDTMLEFFSNNIEELPDELQMQYVQLLMDCTSKMKTIYIMSLLYQSTRL